MTNVHFSKGEKVILDKGRVNESIVTVLSQTPILMFTLVTSDGKYSWEVMTYRLSKIKTNETNA